MLLLFDIDNVIVMNNVIDDSVIQHINNLIIRGDDVGILTKHSFKKISKLLGYEMCKFKYVFTDNGAVCYVDNQMLYQYDMFEHCDRVLLNLIIRKSLSVISSMPIYYKSGQIHIQNGYIYIMPIGTKAGKYEKDVFLTMNKKLSLLDTLITHVKSIHDFDKFFDVILDRYGVYVYPKDWTNDRVLKYIGSDYDKIYYFTNDKNNMKYLSGKINVVHVMNDVDMMMYVDNYVNKLQYKLPGKLPHILPDKLPGQIAW